MVFSWEFVLELVKDLVKAEGCRTPREEQRTGNLRKLAGAARESRYVSAPRLSISRAPLLRRSDQNGRTITSTTMIAVAIPGISLIIRTALLDSGRSPRASLLP